MSRPTARPTVSPDRSIGRQHSESESSILRTTEDRLSRRLGLLAAVVADEALGRPIAETVGLEAAAVALDAPGWNTAYRLTAGLVTP